MQLLLAASQVRGTNLSKEHPITEYQGDKMALERSFLAGLDMNMADYDGRTALHLACVENHPGCVKYLLEACQVGRVASAPLCRWTWRWRTGGGTRRCRTPSAATTPGAGRPSQHISPRIVAILKVALQGKPMQAMKKEVEEETFLKT